MESPQIECQLDGIEWSLNCRYAVCAISIKEISSDQQPQLPQSSQATALATNKNEQKPAVVVIQVYDTASRTVISEDMGLDCGYKKTVYHYASVIKQHPVRENVFLTCFDGGIALMYDIKAMKIIQEIVEYGIYSIDQFTMNNAVDVDFSSDGDYIALASFYGTLSLYSNQSHRVQRYLATRVQQFFSYDVEKHDHNPYESQEQQPQLCGYELNPYEMQPGPPILGRFQRQNRSLTREQRLQEAEEFERKRIFAQEFAEEEEKFVKDQLLDGLRQGYFNVSANNVSNASQNANEDILIMPLNAQEASPRALANDQQRQPASFMQMDSPARVENRNWRGNGGHSRGIIDEDMRSGSDQALLEDDGRAGSQRRGARQGGRRLHQNQRQRLVRYDELAEDVDNAFDEDQVMSDDESERDDEPSDEELDDQDGEDERMSGEDGSVGEETSQRDQESDVICRTRRRGARPGRAPEQGARDQLPDPQLNHEEDEMLSRRRGRTQ